MLALSSFTLAVVGTGGVAMAQTPGRPALAPQTVPVEGGGSYRDVSAGALAGMLKSKDFLLVNVHIPYAGEIEGTDLFVPFNQVEARVAELPADKGAKLGVYCRSGGMSAIAARALVKLGYTNVWNLDGGMIGWEEAGYPLVRKSR